MDCLMSNILSYVAGVLSAIGLSFVIKFFIKINNRSVEQKNISAGGDVVGRDKFGN
ncbi:MAG TPA: hypothetical protein PKB11_01665 [Desulfovibrio sp.]|uniref:hypothetical protein n=1 Tax=Desulfovibrio sp. TaxID=885 RepID=UPI002B5FE0FD|nr:hypothetical protein [Desulfovibrio sp.]HMM37439.1 hypothetical protein [Desulfovibrio sp.]